MCLQLFVTQSRPQFSLIYLDTHLPTVSTRRVHLYTQSRPHSSSAECLFVCVCVFYYFLCICC